MISSIKWQKMISTYSLINPTWLGVAHMGHAIRPLITAKWHTYATLAYGNHILSQGEFRSGHHYDQQHTHRELNNNVFPY